MKGSGVLMITSVETYLRRGQRIWNRWTENPWFHTGVSLAAWGGCGFVLSAASLAGSALPLAMGLVLSLTGGQALAAALGSMLGYRVFWAAAGLQGMVWVFFGAMAALLLGKRKITRESPLLLPALAGLVVSASGLAFQIFLEDQTSVGIYLLRVGLGALSAWLFLRTRQRQEPLTRGLCLGVGVLALAQVAPVSWLSLGYPGAALLAAGGAFPGAVLGGLALDLAQITPVPMTAVLCLGYLPRILFRRTAWLHAAGPAAAALLVMGLCGAWDLTVLPGLLLGGALGAFLPARPENLHRRGETGTAQVRLELAAGVLSQTQQLLLEGGPPPIDEEAIFLLSRERACNLCPARKSCTGQAELSPELLHSTLEDAASLGVPCRRPGRLLTELRRGQERLRMLKSDRERQGEYRWALVQQYRFLSEYLQSLSDRLPRSADSLRKAYRPEISVYSEGKERTNGDRCACFEGTACRYYVLLCDGMGVGLGAAREGQTALSLLRQMLTAGFPAEYALGSLNSLLALRSRAGAVSVDLCELQLDSGKAVLYKWGAAPSYLLRRTGAEKIGTATLPPGFSVTESRETAQRLSLRRGEALILTSDGVDGEEVLRRCELPPDGPPGELAAMFLEEGRGTGEDDATVAVVRLLSAGLSE